MHVLITGITGFIGTYLARRLTAAGVRVSGMAADPVPRVGGVAVRRIDVLDSSALEALVEETDPETIVHLAGLSHVGESWKRPGDYLRINFCGTCNLLRAAGRRRVIFASSAEVYGDVPEEEQPISEDRHLQPLSPYAMTKACAEKVALDHGAIVVRSFNTIGAGQSMLFALPSFVHQLAAIKRGDQEGVLHVGNLEPRRDFLHAADAAAAFHTLIEAGARGTVYNLASGDPHSIKEALDLLREISGVPAELQEDADRKRQNDIPLLHGAAERLRRLGWQPEHSFTAALEELWREVWDRP